jgi:hypothetical protein
MTLEIRVDTFNPHFSPRFWKGRALQAAEKFDSDVILNRTPLSSCQHHPGARRATPPHLRRGVLQALPS